ncbi:MAG TPA: PEP-CTERM sorting domain-containing protein [Acidobacteriaceae bacterium]|nr:PEP-CTERM sorting domain-containing protein [Acidobacteriaceae bacterium]
MKFRLSAVGLAVALLSSSLSAHAHPIYTVFDLSNVGLTLGVGGPADGTLNGTLYINTPNNLLDFADVTTSPGTVDPFNGAGGFEFVRGGYHPGWQVGTTPNSTVVSETSTTLELTSNDGNDLLMLIFESPLDGTGPAALSPESYEDEVGGIGRRYVAAGSYANVTPEPSSVALLGTGLLSLGGLVRRRRRSFGTSA